MPNLASSNRVSLQYVKEVSFGVTPGTTGKALRMTGETLDYALTYTGDKEIRSDRQNVSTTVTNAMANGDIKFHMQYSEYDPFIAGAMQNPVAAFGTNGVGATFTAILNATSISAAVIPTAANAFEQLKKGQWFKLNAPGNVNDGLFLRASTLTAATAGQIFLDASTVLTPTASAGGASIAAARYTNGTTMMSFSIERVMADVTQYICYRGMNVSKMAITFSSGALTDGTFSFMGKDGLPAAGSAAISGPATASQTYTIQNAVKGVGQLWEAGVPLTSTFIKTLALTVDNTLRAQDAIGTLGAVGIGAGTFHVSGTMTVYFADASLYNKYINSTFTSLTISTLDTSKNGYVITLPNIMIVKNTVQAGGKDSDLMANISFEAYADTLNVDATLQQTMFIDRLGAAVT